jgi:hypothetical protein
MNNKKNIAFTVNFGNYDNLPFPYTVGGASWHKVLFTDDKKTPQKRGWDEIIYVDLPNNTNLNLEAKKIKWGIHNYFKDADYYLYYDASIIIKHNLPPSTLRIRHPKRDNVYQELEALLLNNNREHPDTLVSYYNKIIGDKTFEDTKLFLNGFFIRPNTPIENKIGNEVVEHLVNETTRDQLIFPYILSKNNYQYTQSELKEPKFFIATCTLHHHKKVLPKQGYLQTIPINKKNFKNSSDIKIYSFTPFASNKNFGKACNDHCEQVPNDDDWILIRDCDTMFLIPETSEQLYKIVRENNDKYDLIGCYSNRIGLDYQLPNKILSENDSVRHHIKIAQDLYKTNGSTVIPLNKNIAGMFLLFKKSAWKRHKFEEGLSVTKKDYDGQTKKGYIDYWFSNFFALNKKVGLATGVYIFHVYRLFGTDRKDQRHLQ